MKWRKTMTENPRSGWLPVRRHSLRDESVFSVHRALPLPHVPAVGGAMLGTCALGRDAVIFMGPGTPGDPRIARPGVHSRVMAIDGVRPGSLEIDACASGMTPGPSFPTA